MLNIKKDFKWFEQNKGITYIDSGATTLKPNVVIQAVNDYLTKQCTNPHNSDSSFAYKAHEVMNECRQECANLINANYDEIIFTSGATESLNLFAAGLDDYINEGDEIILTHYEHASNLLPWFNLAQKKKAIIKYATSNKFSLTEQDFKRVLTNKTKIVSFTGTSNLFGNTLPVEEIAKLIREFNNQIIICVDVAQMVPHKKIDVKKWNIDFAAYSGHKMFSPTGIGVAYINKKWLNKLKPFRYGGGMNGEINPSGYTLLELFARFEGGTPNVSGIYGLLAATKYLNSIGYDAIAEHEKEIFNMLYNGLKDCKHVIVYNWDAKSTTLAFNIEGVHSQDVANYLGKRNIIVRSGLSCAKLLDHVICQPSVVRASFYIYNDKKDVEKLIEILKKVTKEDIINDII